MSIQASNLPKRVEDLVKEIKGKNPSYDDSQVWATAWSVYCKHIQPGDAHCTRGPEGYLTKQADYSRIPTSTLAPAIQRVLAEVRFNKRQISVETASSYTMYSAGDDGAKGFAALVDLDTNQAAVTWGAFGGGGLGQKLSPVDDVRAPAKPLPDHLAVIHGQIGGRDPYASITVSPKALPRLIKPGRQANGDMMQYFADNPDKLQEKLERDKAKKQANAASTFINAKTTQVAKTLYAAIKGLKTSYADKPDIPDNVGGMICHLFNAKGNAEVYHKLHSFLGNMSGVGSGFGLDSELLAIARRFSHSLNDAEIIAVGMLLLRSAKRPRAADSLERWAAHNLNLAQFDPAAAATSKLMSPGEAFEATITPEILGMATWAWDKVGKNAVAAEALAYAVAEDANWRSLKSVGSPQGASYPEEVYETVADQLSFNLDEISAFIVALMRLAGQRGKAEGVKKEALQAFKDLYQAQMRVASRYMAAMQKAATQNTHIPREVGHLVQSLSHKLEALRAEMIQNRMVGSKALASVQDATEVAEKAWVAAGNHPDDFVKSPEGIQYMAAARACEWLGQQLDIHREKSAVRRLSGALDEFIGLQVLLG